MLMRFALTVLLLTLAEPVFAGPAEELARRLTALPATVLSERNGEVLIDAGSSAGVNSLDLFAVAGPETPVVHPQTGAVLGAVAETKAVLQVTWTKENFSGARRVRGETPLTAGDKATRFADVEARFVACGTDAEALLADLRRALPGLRWGNYQTSDDCSAAMMAAPQADMFFVATHDTLSLRDAAGNLLQQVQRPAPLAAAPTSIATAAPAGATFRERWYGGDWKGAPVALAIGNLDGDPRAEVAVADPRRIRLGRSENRIWKDLGELVLPTTHQLLALDTCDVDGDGRDELSVTASRDQELSSFLYRWQDGSLVEIQRNLPYMMSKMTDAQGKPILFGQGLEAGHWGGSPVRLVWDGKRLVPGEALVLPPKTGLRGYARVDSDSGRALLRLGWNDSLEVLDAAGESLWKSDSAYGGSETFIEVPGDTAQGSEHNTRNLYVQQRFQSIDGDQVLIPVNIGSRLFNRQISYEESQVQLVRWDGRTLHTLWETPKEKGYLADCAWADIDNDGAPELAMLIAFSKDGLFTTGRYSLVVLER